MDSMWSVTRSRSKNEMMIDDIVYDKSSTDPTANVYKINEQMFGVEGILIYGTESELRDWIEENLEHNLNPAEFRASTTFVTDTHTNRSTAIVCLKKTELKDDLDKVVLVSCLAHECLHVATQVLSDRGIDWKSTGDELLAYVQMYYYRNFLINLDLF